MVSSDISRAYLDKFILYIVFVKNFFHTLTRRACGKRIKSDFLFLLFHVFSNTLYLYDTIYEKSLYYVHQKMEFFP